MANVSFLNIKSHLIFVNFFLAKTSPDVHKDWLQVGTNGFNVDHDLQE